MKEQSKFTSGKWVACTDATVGIEGADGLIDDFICECDSGMYCDRPFDEMMANARLIAAAPEMYRMLIMAMGSLRDGDVCAQKLADKIEALLARIDGEDKEQ